MDIEKIVPVYHPEKTESADIEDKNQWGDDRVDNPNARQIRIYREESAPFRLRKLCRPGELLASSRVNNRTKNELHEQCPNLSNRSTADSECL